MKFGKSGEWKWGVRSDWDVLLSGFYFDFFLSCLLPLSVLQWHSPGLSPPPRQTRGSLSVSVPRCPDELFHGVGAEVGCWLKGAPRIFLLIDIRGRKISPGRSPFGLSVFLPLAVQTEEQRSSPDTALAAWCGVSVPHSCSLFPPW